MRPRDFICLLGSAAAPWPRSVDELVGMNGGYLIPGLAVAVVQNGKVVMTLFAHIKHRRLATAKTVFQIASVTKQFVATGVMLLVEGGKVSTDAPLTRWLDDGISVAVLANAQTGLSEPYEIARNIAKFYVPSVP
jgi:CubicO group peptidase (beta-lactamase class C family)